MILKPLWQRLNTTRQILNIRPLPKRLLPPNAPNGLPIIRKIWIVEVFVVTQQEGGEIEG